MLQHPTLLIKHDTGRSSFSSLCNKFSCQNALHSRNYIVGDKTVWNILARRVRRNFFSQMHHKSHNFSRYLSHFNIRFCTKFWIKNCGNLRNDTSSFERTKGLNVNSGCADTFNETHCRGKEVTWLIMLQWHYN